MIVYYAVMLTIALLWLLASATRGRGLSKENAHGWRPPEEDAPRISTTRAFGIAGSLVLILVAVLRWRVGTDYDTYAQSYFQFRDVPFSAYSLTNEPGLRFVARLAQYVHDDYVTMFAIVSVLTLGLVARTIIKYSEDVMLSLMLFVLIGAWQSSFNGIRQWLACAIVFAGHRYIIERRFWHFTAVVGVASLFHVSALALILAYFIPSRRLGLGRITLLIIGVLVAAQSYEVLARAIEALRPDIADLSSAMYFQEQVNPLRILVSFGPVALYAAMSDKSRIAPAGQFYVNTAIVHAALSAAAINSAYIARFSIYTLPFLALAIPSMLNMKDRASRTLLIASTLGLYFVTWHIDTTFSAYTASFRWVFQRDA